MSHGTRSDSDNGRHRSKRSEKADTSARLKDEMDKLRSDYSSDDIDIAPRSESNSDWYNFQGSGESSRHWIERGYKRKNDGQAEAKLKKFIGSVPSLGQMFAPEGRKPAPDIMDVTGGLISRDVIEGRVLPTIPKPNRGERRMQGPQLDSKELDRLRNSKVEEEPCEVCHGIESKDHLTIDKLKNVNMVLMDSRTFLSSMSNVIIRSTGHDCDSFVAASDRHHCEVQQLIKRLSKCYASRGYRCIIMETYIKNRRPSSRELASCKNHFTIHCQPIREKYFEKARMCFKQTIQLTGSEWSINRKLVETDGRGIHRCLPKSLSYFWVCFGDLSNGFGHVIESERDFSRYFGFEVLSGLLDKSFKPKRLYEEEDQDRQLERVASFKKLYSEHDFDII